MEPARTLILQLGACRTLLPLFLLHTTAAARSSAAAAARRCTPSRCRQRVAKDGPPERVCENAIPGGACEPRVAVADHEQLEFAVPETVARADLELNTLEAVAVKLPELDAVGGLQHPHFTVQVDVVDTLGHGSRAESVDFCSVSCSCPFGVVCLICDSAVNSKSGNRRSKDHGLKWPLW